jgi:hypothetical protein
MIIKESLQVSAGTTVAFAGWDARKATTRVDREGLSSLFRRKMRPRSGLFAPRQYPNAVACIPWAVRSPLRRAPGAALPGRSFARSLTK